MRVTHEDGHSRGETLADEPTHEDERRREKTREDERRRTVNVIGIDVNENTHASRDER